MKTRPNKLVSHPFRLGEGFPVEMDLSPFMDEEKGKGELSLWQRVLDKTMALEDTRVDTNKAGPGSLHVGQHAGLHYNVLNASQVREFFPTLDDLYRGAATECLREWTGVRALQPLDISSQRGLNINITTESHWHEWHVDGEDLYLTGSMGIRVPSPGMPGAFCYHDGVCVRKEWVNKNRVLVFPSHTPHAVEPCEDLPRITMTMAWDLGEDDGGVKGLSSYLYGERRKVK